jgi:hypothetical protein
VTLSARCHAVETAGRARALAVCRNCTVNVLDSILRPAFVPDIRTDVER